MSVDALRSLECIGSSLHVVADCEQQSVAQERSDGIISCGADLGK